MRGLRRRRDAPPRSPQEIAQRPGGPPRNSTPGTVRPGTTCLGALRLGFAPAMPPDRAFGLVRVDQRGFKSRLPHSQVGGLGSRLCGFFLIYPTGAVAAQPSDKDIASHLSSINVGSKPPPRLFWGFRRSPARRPSLRGLAPSNSHTGQQFSLILVPFQIWLP